MSPSQLASRAVPVCQAANEHPHSSSVGALPVRAADALDNLAASSMKPTCQAPAERNAEAAGLKARQLHLVSRPARTAESAEAESQTEPGREKQHDEPQKAAKPAALDSPVQPALLPLSEEGVERALALLKEESLRESPAWKVRAAREAAQHAGNTLFADICQPGAVSHNPCTQCAKPDPSFLSRDPSIIVVPAKAGMGCILPVADDILKAEVDFACRGS